MGLIRLILAISVIIAHSSSFFGLSLVGGQLAVQVFFIISGFYMALILTEKYNQKKHQKLFIGNRLLKIFPIYWVVLILSFVYESINLATNSNPQDVFAFFRQNMHLNLFSTLSFLFSNIAIFGQDILLFLGLNSDTGNFFFTPNFRLLDLPLYDFLLVPQAWTLALELTFYLLAPFLVKFKSKSLIILMAISLALRLILYKNGLNHDPWSYRFFPTELFYFISGIVTYRIYNTLKSINIKNSILYTFFGGYLALIIFYQYIPHNTIKIVFLFSTTILLLPFIFKLTKNNKFDSAIGELSYPIYISHFLIINILTRWFSSLNHDYLGIVATVISIITSVLLLKLIMNPIDKFRQKRLLVSNV